MVFSSSFQKGRMPVTCQLCEESITIQWKCLQCDFLLCTKCKKLHEKVKSAEKHTIIDIKDIGDYQHHGQSLDFRSIPCDVHQGQTCCLFCQTCEEIVCPLCIAKTHNTHHMIEVEEGFKLSLETIRSFQTEYSKDSTEQAKEITILQSFRSTQNDKYEKEKWKILEQDKVLKDEVEKHTKILISELDQKWKNLQIAMGDNESSSKKVMEQLMSRNRKLTDALQSTNVKEVFDIVKAEKLDTKKKQLPVNNDFNELPEFKAAEMTTSSIESIHGILKDVKKCPAKFEFQVLKKYTTELDVVESLVCNNDGSLWISNNISERLQKINTTNSTLQLSKTIRVKVASIAELPSGDLFLSTYESNLQILSKSTNTITQTGISVASSITLAVHVTEDQKIIISTQEKGPGPFPVNGPRQVIVMDTEGRKDQEYERDHSGQPMFTLPRCITSDNNNNIYVTDTTSERWTGRLVALDRANNDIKWIYQGQQDTQSHLFTPLDLLVTQYNNILVADEDNHMIHVLDPTGQCVKLLNTEDYGIEFPFSIDTDNKGHLFIGCNCYTSRKQKAPLYMIKFSGF